jgi:hypothetical protein
VSQPTDSGHPKPGAAVSEVTLSNSSSSPCMSVDAHPATDTQAQASSSFIERISPSGRISVFGRLTVARRGDFVQCGIAHPALARPG